MCGCHRMKYDRKFHLIDVIAPKLCNRIARVVIVVHGSEEGLKVAMVGYAVVELHSGVYRFLRHHRLLLKSLYHVILTLEPPVSALVKYRDCNHIMILWS